MAEVETTQPPPNGGGDNIIEDADEAETKVCSRFCSLSDPCFYTTFAQEIMLMKQRVAEMEREAEKLRELQAAAEKENGDDVVVAMETDEDKTASDGRSVYVGNVSSFVFSTGVTLTRRCSCRSTTVQLRRRFKGTSRHVERSTE